MVFFRKSRWQHHTLNERIELAQNLSDMLEMLSAGYILHFTFCNGEYSVLKDNFELIETHYADFVRLRLAFRSGDGRAVRLFQRSRGCSDTVAGVSKAMIKRERSDVVLIDSDTDTRARSKSDRQISKAAKVCILTLGSEESSTAQSVSDAREDTSARNVDIDNVYDLHTLTR